MPRIHDILEPARTALLVVDVQNDFCAPGGATARSGKSVQMCAEMAPRLIGLVDAGRTHGVRVLHVHTNGTAYTDSDAWRCRVSETPRSGNCQEGTWGAEPYAVLPRAGEPIVVKHRNSAFYNTRLDTILRAWNLRTVVVTGVASNVSVEMTARDAVQRDYDMVFVSDCTAAYEPYAHDAALYNMRNFYGRVATAGEVARIWSGYAEQDARGERRNDTLP